ncbi:MAG: DNA primase [Candidatus Pacebacteria bacterium]|nr:DNA primase [Candidatus Paceibacterota bacterium]
MADTAVQQIKDRLDIVEVVSGYLKLEKTGINLRARCPFHQEKGPSFFVSPARQMFKCFGCGQSGSVFDFVMKIEGIEFPDALKILAKRAGVELHEYHPQDQTERMRLLDICELATKFFEKQLQETVSGKKCQEYLKKRGLTEETIKQWRLGYAVDQWRALGDFLVGRGYKREEIVKAGLAVEQEKFQSPYDRFRQRIIFPVFDFNGQVIGFGARKTDFLEGNTDQGPKYLNTPNTLLYDKSRALYGLHFAKMDIRQKNFCILTEGYMDVLLSHQASFTNTVASSGTALTSFQLNVIKRYTSNLHTAFDRDTAGSSATARGIDLAQKENFDIKVILMPQGKDPADIISQNPAEWQTAIDSAKDITEFYFEDAFLKFDVSSPQGKKQIGAFLLPQIKKLPNSILQSHWSQKLAQALAVSAESIAEELKKIPLSAVVLTEADQPTLSQNQNEKTRFRLLEEKILALTLMSPGLMDFMDNDDIGLFSPHFKTVLTCFKEKAVCDQATLGTAVKYFESNFEIKTVLDNCFFQAETEQIDDAEQEMQVCLEYFRRVAWQGQLKKISDELKLAESAGDLQKKKEIMDKINFLTKNRPA